MTKTTSVRAHVKPKKGTYVRQHRRRCSAGPRDFTFPGRYTIREMEDVWYIYDREKMGFADGSPRADTFTKAVVMLDKWKTEKGDELE